MAYKIERSMIELADLVKEKIRLRWDIIIFISGLTGTGKSSFGVRFLNHFPAFNMKEHLTFSRAKTIDLIINQKKSLIWNDEMIDAGYRRHFFQPEQITLISTLTKYRNNQNVFVGCIPNFHSLDKELIKLCSLHINIPERGRAILHCPLTGKMFSDDPFDIKLNTFLENKWSEKKLKKPAFKIPHHRYSTYIGEIRFSKLSEKQEGYYEMLKDTKRAEASKEADGNGEQNQETSFYDKIIPLIKEGKMTEDTLRSLCLFNNKNFTSTKTRINQLLRDKGLQSLNNYLNKPTVQTQEDSFKGLE